MNSLGQVSHNEIEPGVLNDTPSIAEDYMPYARKVFKYLHSQSSH